MAAQDGQPSVPLPFIASTIVAFTLFCVRFTKRPVLPSKLHSDYFQTRKEKKDERARMLRALLPSVLSFLQEDKRNFLYGILFSSIRNTVNPRNGSNRVTIRPPSN